MPGVMKRLVPLVGAIVLLAWGCAQALAPAPSATPKAQEKDPRPLYQMLLEWAVLETPLPGQTRPLFFPERDLLKEASVIRVVKGSVPSGVTLSLPDKRVQVLSEQELQGLADREGELHALQFTPLMDRPEGAEIGLDLVWFVRKDSPVLPLSGGGVRLLFRWHEGAWKFERSRGLRIS